MSLIECRDLVKTYTVGDDTVHALDHVSVDVNQRDFIAICGPSGSGKSTLANVIGGLDRPDAGSVIVDGVDLARAKDKDLSAYRNRHVGFIFQSFNLQAHESALENVISPLVVGGVGRRKERLAKGLAALDRVGLADRARHKPGQLSGGQRQRVAIARALVNDPSIIIADEPTGNLDSARGAGIMEELERLNREGVTMLIITHDRNVASRAGRVVQIIDGRITESAGAR